MPEIPSPGPGSRAGLAAAPWHARQQGPNKARELPSILCIAGHMKGGLEDTHSIRITWVTLLQF